MKTIKENSTMFAWMAIAAFLAVVFVQVAFRPGMAWGEPVTSGLSALHQMGEIYKARWEDDTTTNVKAIPASSTQYTIPDVLNSAYEICAVGNSVCLLVGSNPTVACTAGNHTRWVPAGTCTKLIRFDCVDSSNTNECSARKVAYIAGDGVATGFVYFHQYNISL